MKEKRLWFELRAALVLEHSTFVSYIVNQVKQQLQEHVPKNETIDSLTRRDEAGLRILTATSSGYDQLVVAVIQ